MYTRGKVLAPSKFSDMFRANKFRPLEDEYNIKIPINIEAKGKTTTPYLFIRCRLYDSIDKHSRSM